MFPSSALLECCGMTRTASGRLASHPSDLGVADGAPHVEDKLVREGKVAQRLVQGLGKLVGVLLVLPQLHHGGGCGRRDGSEKRFSESKHTTVTQMSSEKGRRGRGGDGGGVPSSLSLMPM